MFAETNSELGEMAVILTCMFLQWCILLMVKGRVGKCMSYFLVRWNEWTKIDGQKRYTWMPLGNRVRMSLQTMERRNSTRRNSRGL